MPIGQQVAKQVNPPEQTRRQVPLPIGEAEDGDVCEEGNYYADYPDTYQQPEARPPQPKPQRRTQAHSGGGTESKPKVAEPWDEPKPSLTAGITLPIATMECDPRKFIHKPLGIHTLMPDYYTEHEGIEPVSLSMHGFPYKVNRAIDRVGVLSYTKSKARFNPVVGCILKCAVEVWNQHGIIAKAIEVNTGFKGVDKKKYSEVQHDMIGSFFDKNQPEITIAGGGKRKNAWVPRSIRDELSALAGDAGVDVGAFAIVSLMMILCREDCTLPELVTVFAGQVSTFLETLRERAFGQEALMVVYAKAHAKAKDKK